jgi:hypothetical protein
MLNLRGAYRWYLFRGGLASPQLMAQSEALSWRDVNEPTGVHLALTGKFGEMHVQWTTHDEPTPVLYWVRAPAWRKEQATTARVRGTQSLRAPAGRKKHGSEPGQSPRLLTRALHRRHTGRGGWLVHALRGRNHVCAAAQRPVRRRGGELDAVAPE